MATMHDVRRWLVAAARRHSRVAHEAEDVAHDIILAALRRGLPLDADGFARTVEASARQHGAFVARSAARRQARELLCAVAPEAARTEEPRERAWVPPTSLPSALHTTLLLLSLGHTKAEMRAAFGITDAALRKRLQGLRARAPLARPHLAERPASPGLRRTQVGLLPRLAGSRGAGRLIAGSDCDGHGIIFSEVLTNLPGTATTHASASDLRGDEAPAERKPC